MTSRAEVPQTGIGAPVNRVEARDKVTGVARYTADVRLAGMAHAALVAATVSVGRVRRIQTARALAEPGVLTVLTHRDPTPWQSTPADTKYIENRFPLADDTITYYGQYLAIVVAETPDQAEHAASLVDVDYEEHTPVPTLDRALPDAYTASGRLISPPWPQRVVLPPGADPLSALDDADVRVDSTFRVPHFSHAALEPGAVVAHWSDDTLTLHDCSQNVHAHREVVAAVFGLPQDRVRVLSPLVGGGFGSKTGVWAHSLLASYAAREVRRPVKLVLTRKQAFTAMGHQPPIIQRIRIGASSAGRLAVILHDTVNATEVRGDRPEPTIVSTASSYAAPVLSADAKVAKVNIGPSVNLRAPGDGPGSFALESAMDELAYRLGMDPLELRRRNHLASDPLTGRPYSAKHLLEAYELGADRFGWARRTPEPRSMRDGGDLVGYGMATAVHGQLADRARAEVEIRADGTAEVRTATQEIGTGTLTLVAQVTAAGTGVPLGRVAVRVGDTNLPGPRGTPARAAPATRDPPCTWPPRRPGRAPCAWLSPIPSRRCTGCRTARSRRPMGGCSTVTTRSAGRRIGNCWAATAVTRCGPRASSSPGRPTPWPRSARTSPRYASTRTCRASVSPGTSPSSTSAGSPTTRRPGTRPRAASCSVWGGR